MRPTLLVALVVLAGCGRESDVPAPSATPSAAPSPALPAPDSLVGEYRVAGIDGRALDAPFGIALSITQGQVSFEPKCAGFVWQYAYRDGKLDIEQRQEKLNHPPPPVCAAPVHPLQRQLGEALDAVDRAGRTPANGLELSGGGRSVLLFSQ